MEIELEEQELPFEIPEALLTVLKANPAEYGTGGDIGTVLPCQRVWGVRCGSDLLGFAWVRADAPKGQDQSLYFSQALLPGAREKGIGQRVRESVEDVLRSEGVSHLYVQVNNNLIDKGLRVRERLLRSGYIVDRAQVAEKYLQPRGRQLGQLSDQDLVRAYLKPLHFKKSLQ